MHRAVLPDWFLARCVVRVNHMTAGGGVPNWPALQKFAGKSPESHADLFARAPWSDVAGGRDLFLLQGYVDASGRLPGRLPLRAATSPAWMGRLIVHNKAYRNPRMTAGARRERMRRIYQRIERKQCERLILVSYGLDTWAYRTQGEVNYVPGLVEAMPDPEIKWDDAPSDELICYPQTILPQNFADRHEQMYQLQYYEALRFERKARNRHGYLLASQNVEGNWLKPNALAGRYSDIPELFEEYEVRLKFPVELPPAVTYAGYALLSNPHHPLWAVSFRNGSHSPRRGLVGRRCRQATVAAKAVDTLYTSNGTRPRSWRVRSLPGTPGMPSRTRRC